MDVSKMTIGDKKGTQLKRIEKSTSKTSLNTKQSSVE